MGQINIGGIAPDFELPDQEGNLVRLSQFKGKKHVVLFFYPKDETPGCIREACSFRNHYKDFRDLHTEVLGISMDSVNSHKRFSEKRKLPYRLLSDKRNEIKRAFGVKDLLLGLIPGRETFVIDKAGRIQHHFASNLRPDMHMVEALQAIKQIEDSTLV